MKKKKLKNYDQNSNKGYIFEKDIEYPKYVHNMCIDSSFLPERMKIKKCKRLVCSLFDKNNYVSHIRTLKQALSHVLIFKKVHKVIQFDQKAWFTSYIGAYTKLRTKAKNDFKKYFF